MKKPIALLILTFLFSIEIICAQNSLNFDGTNDFIQTNNPGVLGANDRTFEAWVKVDVSAPSSNLTILDYGLNAAGSRNTFLIDGNKDLRFISGGTNGNLAASSVSVTVGQWVHVAFVLDNGTGYTYINGSQVSTGSLSNVNTPSGNANITIGERVSGGSIPFSGNIDEVRIWNVARTPSEILADMNSELCSYPSSLVGYYKFNQGVARGNNVGLTDVIGELGDTAIANNFSMVGPSSNWDTGAVISPVIPLNFGITVDTLNQMLSSNDTNSNVRYQWYDCNTNSILVGDTNRTYLSRSGGNYAVILSNGACTDTSACLLVSFSGGGNLPGEALSFDGVDDFVQTEFPGVLDSNNRTFEAWVKVSTTAPSSNLAILDYGLNAVGSRNTFMVNAGRGVSFISGGTNANLGTLTGIVQPGQWTHIAFVLNNGTGYIYVNGIQEGTGNLSSVNTPQGNDSLIIGQRVAGGSIPFAGEIDEIRIWNVARTPAEILADMNTEYCGQTNGLLAHYNMNDGISGGNNTSISKIHNSINTGSGFLNNFALTGPNSNFTSPGASITMPVIDTTLNQSGVTLTANDTTVSGYQWYDCSNNSILIGDTARTFIAPMNGSYAVILTKNGCKDTSACTQVIGVGLDKLRFESGFYISQNPVKNSFSLVNNNEIRVTTTIRSITGKIIEMKQNRNDLSIDFDLTGRASGIYILSIEGEGGEATNFKVVKQ